MKLQIVQGAKVITVQRTLYGWLVNSGPAFAVIPATAAPIAHALPLDAFVAGRSVAGAIVDAACTLMQ